MLRILTASLLISVVTLGLCAPASGATLSDFVYAYDFAPPAVGTTPSPFWPDGANKLNDNTLGIGAPFGGAFVGYQQAPPDSANPQPQVTATFSQLYNFTSLEITYAVSASNGVFAPDSVDVSFSNTGLPGSYSSPVTFNAFTGAPDGEYSTTFNLTGNTGQYVRLAFKNDQEWTFLSELDFEGAAVPEPSSAAALVAGVAGILGRRGRRLA